ncbi:LuxR family transcriptional regulator [Virgisporangium aliadipatigenens]|uniref:LuxR family transcriptional regulator n=1 Tax=Virgisporangium aliadipatigenens TaxID=741659 RepID=A0A8J4DVT5_9ACTN|nr:LuxR family transcriptional regulator [Virgisporangium aliadipatigenens]
MTTTVAGETDRGVLFGGGAGVGKSRLLREGVARLDPERHWVVTANATAATTGFPLGAFATALPAESPPRVTGAGLLRWAADVLYRQAGSRSLVLAVDDAHLLDPLSAALVHQLARAGPATLIGTLRTGVDVPEAVRALWVDDLVTRIELDPLTGADTERLLRAACDGPVDTASAARLWELSLGNAHLLRELIQAARDGSALVRRYGIWHWTGALPLSPTLADAVDHRMGRITAPVREVLELVAFAAPVGLSLLVKATDGAAVELAEERGLIRVGPDDRRTVVTLAHPLFGAVVRQRCPLTRVRRLLADLAHLIESTGARRHDDLLRVALWRLDSDTARDPGQLLRACRQAFGRFEIAQATRLGRAAVAAGGGFDAAELLAALLALDDRAAEAVRVLDAVADELTGDRQRTRWRCARAAAAFWGLGDARAVELLSTTSARRSTVAAGDPTDGGEPFEPVSPRNLAPVKAVEASMRLHLGEPAQAGRLAREVLADSAAGPEHRAVATATLAHMEAASGDPASARARLDALGQGCLTAPHVRLAVEAARGAALVIDGSPGAVDDFLSAGFARVARERDFRLGGGLLTVLQAQAARLRGDLAVASRLASQAAGELSDGHGFAVLAHAERAHAAALMGDADLATEAMADCDRLRRDTARLLHPWVEQARAWTHVAAGNRREALATLDRLAARMRADGLAGHETTVLLDLARLGSPAPERARRLAATVTATAAPAVFRYVAAVAAGDGAALRGAAEAFAALGLHLYAAEAAAGAVTVLRRLRAKEAPEAALRLAGSLARCPDARTPALEIEHPTLTHRERQIARLAAAGVASKAIAEQLYLSARTVDNHLMRVYAKLGVDGRHRLAAALRALPPEE